MLTRSSGTRPLFVCAILLATALSSSTVAEPDGFVPGQGEIAPDGLHVLDGSYVIDVGELRVNITNLGLIGSQYTGGYTYSHAPSGEWPGGSGDEYLWGAGLWIGGRLGGEVTVSTGQIDQEFRPRDRMIDTIYEAQGGIVLRPEQNAVATGMRLPSGGADDDGDGRYDEDMLNGVDDDLDGRVDEDFGQLGDQMFTCTMFDNTRLAAEIYPEHQPLGLKVVQRAVGWDRELRENIVALDYKISNVGHNELTDVYLGFYVDCDIQNRDKGSTQPDDLVGSFSGIVRGSDNLFYRAEVAYMWDGAEEDPLPGYFGVALLNHTVAFDGVTAPFIPTITSFNVFSTSASVNQEGEPNNDADRYYLMSHAGRDRNTRPDESADYKFLMASGPFLDFDVGDELDYQLGLMVADGLPALLETVAEAGRLYAGRWYDADHNWSTGQMGRETLVCLGDYPTPPYGTDPILGHRLSFMDDTCTGGYPVMYEDIVHPETLEQGWVPDKQCVWVNMDNCLECMRTLGVDCNDSQFFYFRGAYHFWRHPDRWTGTGGRETHFPWTVATEEPPMVPSQRVEPRHNRVEIFWDDRSEIVPDPFTGAYDFESYRVWRVDHWVPPGGMSDNVAPPATAWGMVAEWDLVNEIPAGIGNSPNAVALGRNTSLDDILYEPVCLTDERFEGLAAAMQDLVDSDPSYLWFERPPVRGLDGAVQEFMKPFVKWESYPDVLDTFFAVTGRAGDAAVGVMEKRPTRYYHYIDENQPNGFRNYYSVVARDHRVVWDGEKYVPGGYGIQADPGNHFQMATPRPDAQTVAAREAEGVNIYVYPNPATLEALEEYQSREPSLRDPTGVHITFNNLPRAHNTIRIYTTAGDLVDTIHHDGTTQGGAATWDLMTRNGQEIVSGIYLYAVHSDADFEPFRGRFVVIR